MIYNNDRMEIVKILKDIQDKKEQSRLIIGGDWNAWVGVEGQWVEEERRLREGSSKRKRSIKERMRKGKVSRSSRGGGVDNLKWEYRKG